MVVRKSSVPVLVAMTCAVLSALSIPLLAQSPAQGAAADLPGKEAVKAFIAARAARNFVPPKTPWGDPDLSGTFTSKDEANTPFERPKEWTGRRIEDITPKELGEAVAERQRDAVERAPFAGGGQPEDGVAIAVPIHWFDSLTARNSRPWHVIEPADGMIPAVTPGGKAMLKPRLGPNGGSRNTYTDRDGGDRCITMTWRGPGLYGNSFQILQVPGYVILRREQIHEARIFRLGNAPAVDSDMRFYQGDGRAHWEGNTLVVEVTQFDRNQDFRGYDPKSLRLIERFTRIAPKTVEWSVTVDDPGIWTRPWTYSIPLTEDETQPIFEYACHEGNYGLANILSAGRADEKKGSSQKQ